MKTVSRNALLPYSAEQMFDLVNDVSSYPLFLPWCAESEVLSDSPDEMTARLCLAKAGLQQHFVTRNRLRRPEEIELQLVDGPFSTLEGRWRFIQLGTDGSKTELDLRFDFNSGLLNLTLGKVFEQAADTLVEAFCARAVQVYGDGYGNGNGNG